MRSLPIQLKVSTTQFFSPIDLHSHLMNTYPFIQSYDDEFVVQMIQKHKHSVTKLQAALQKVSKHYSHGK